ncbi:MAG TPA: type 4a pilus biogenesis protein PilO [candidate division Zixibacteria bacterium]
MDIRDPRNQVRFIFILVLCFVIFLWGKNIFFRNIQEIRNKNNQQENLNKQLVAFQAKKQTIEGLREESEAREREYKSLELLLPEERQIPLFLTQMHGAAQTTQTEIIQITPVGTATVSFYNVDNFNVEVVSNYHGFGRFLSNIANFPFIANISNISMTGLSTAEQENENKSIRVSFKLTTYYIKEGEKLK